MKKGFTSIVIVNYKTKLITADTIQSVLTHVTTSTCEIIVVDNDSNDGSVEYFRQLFPEILVIANEKNLGFGYANNIGAAKAAGQFVLFLNPDTILINDIVARFVDFYSKKNQLRIGAVGSVMIDPDLNQVHSYGSFSPILRKMLPDYNSKKNRTTAADLNKKYAAEVDIVVGANMFMEKAVFDYFDGFDSNIFLYEEEYELQYRMKKGGYASIIINEKSIIHLEGKSSESYFKRRCSFLSLCYVFKKHLPYPLYMAVRLKQMLYALIFFKNPKTTWKEKVDYLQLSVFKK